MQLRYKIRAWLIDLITPHVYDQLHTKYKKRKLWAFNRSSVARGAAAGFLVAFIPLPIQMLSAVLLALLIRGNILIAAASVFVSNPLTFIPINYLIIKVGSCATGQNVPLHLFDSINLKFDNWSNYMDVIRPLFHTIGKQFLVGLIIVSILSACVVFILVNILWVVFSKLIRIKCNRS